MNLMIVEDEIVILNSLANNIPWDRHGIEVVGLAENGQDALAIMQRRKPDILLLDIEMPELDGLSLAERVLAQHPQIKIIILSGHDDFKYAQRAVGLGAVKYLLKPAGDDEILEVVLAAAEEIRKELAEKHSIAELQRLWRSRLPQLQEDFFRNWIANRYDEWEWRKHAKELNLEFSGEEPFVISVCEIDPLTKEESRFTPADLPLLQFSLDRIAKEFLQTEACRVFGDSFGSTVVLFYGLAGESEIDLTKRANVLVSRLLRVVKEVLKLTASAGIGKAGGRGEVPASYQQACRALQERAIYGNEIVIPYLEVKRSSSPIMYDSSFEKRLEVALFTDEAERVPDLMQQYFDQAISQADSAELLYEHLLYLSSVFTRIVQSHGWSMRNVLGEDYEHFLSLDSLRSRSQIMEWVKRTAERIRSFVNDERKSTRHQLVKDVLELVDQRMDEDLSLHFVAERFFVNPSYLSRLFKRETGEAFSAYVLARRMKRAKELLQGDAKVYDVGNAVGFRDISYFAKVFRKYWGVAPSELLK